MAFLEKITKTVTEAGQKTIAKTKELADTSRLNSTISEQEKIVANQYFQIGKLYVSIHKDDYEEDFSGMIAAIADAEAKIRDCKKQIQDIKGVQRCDICGAEAPIGAAFCSSCGATMAVPQAAENSDYVKCADCGANVKKGMRFCTSCGSPMETVAAPVAAAPAAKAPAPKLCTNCGARIEDGLRFCTSCGHPTEAAPAPVAEAPVEEAPADKFCPNCGAHLDDGLLFCTECGTKL